MRILITGAFGYLGSRLAEFLAHNGNKVILGSSHKRSSPDWLPDAKTVTTEWHNPVELQKICKDVDIVIHSAGMNAADCQHDPVKALEFNGVYSARLAEASARAGVSRFFYLSTAHVYGNPLKGRISDKTCPENLHPYATTHLAGEQAVLSTGVHNEMQCMVLRLSNCFGRPSHHEANCWMLLVNDICRQAVEEKSLTVRSNGQQLRDFISIRKLCNDILGLLQSSDMEFGSQHKFVNVSEGHAISVEEMALTVQNRCQQVLGFMPVLKINSADKTKYDGELILEPSQFIQNLKNPNQMNAEVDELLIFCTSHFS